VQPGDGVYVDRGAIMVQADRAYPAGRQVYGTYGSLNSNAKLYAFG
jgi:hypothetical protein